MSATLKTLTGAALAAMMLGGIMTASAQTEEENFDNDATIEEMQTDQDEPLVGLMSGRWIYKYTKINCGHEWMGLTTRKVEGGYFVGSVFIQGLYENFGDFYHQAGEIKTQSFDINIDRFWVTLDTLNASRHDDSYIGDTDIDTFILQVGTRDVHGETFGVKTADKKLLIAPGKRGKKDITAITYGGQVFNPWGVHENTSVEIKNYPNGMIRDVEVQSGWLDNNGTVDYATLSGGAIRNDSDGVIKNINVNSGSLNNLGTIEYARQYDGSIWNGGHPMGLKRMKSGKISFLGVSGGEMVNYRGSIDECQISGGQVYNGQDGVISTVVTCGSGRFVNASVSPVGSVRLYNGGILDNGKGSIDTLYYYGGTIEAEGNIAHFIDMRGAAAGMDEGVIDEGYVDEDFSDNAVIDDADFGDASWQDAVPMGEEVW